MSNGNELGAFSFAPTFDNAKIAGRTPSTSAAPQGAIQTFNFRLPKVTGAAGANALSPLQGDTPRASFGGAVLRSVLQTVLGPEEVSDFMGGGGFDMGSPSSVGGGGRDSGQDVLAMLAGGGSFQEPRAESPSPSAGVVPQPTQPQAPPFGTIPRAPGPVIRPGGVEDERREFRPPDPSVGAASRSQAPAFGGARMPELDLQTIF